LPIFSKRCEPVEIRMKRGLIAAVVAFAVWSGNVSSGAPVRFEKVSDHCYYLQLGSGENIAAIVTDDGIVVVDPPEEPDLSLMVEDLKRLSPKKVRWVVFSSPRSARSAGARFFAEQGALLIGSSQLRTLSPSVPGVNSKESAAPNSNSADAASYPWLIFDRQIHLFPSNLEVKIIALEQKAVTGGDVVLYVPSEKVLLVGKLYEAARYPDIDTAALGNAGTWVEGAKQVIDSVPILKSAIPPKPAVPLPAALLPKPALPQSKADPKTEPEVTLEEGIAVVSSLGEVSNLQNMKDLVSACQKLRTDMSRAVRAGRSCDNFLASSRANIYRVYGNFNAYAGPLCETIRDSKFEIRD
jgi:glyoxylase-like metal-dependent hydrolase (beta-lactamase superfamily II)